MDGLEVADVLQERGTSAHPFSSHAWLETSQWPMRLKDRGRLTFLPRPVTGKSGGMVEHRDSKTPTGC